MTRTKLFLAKATTRTLDYGDLLETRVTSAWTDSEGNVVGPYNSDTVEEVVAQMANYPEVEVVLMPDVGRSFDMNPRGDI